MPNNSVMRVFMVGSLSGVPEGVEDVFSGRMGCAVKAWKAALLI
jgi:hypothetical protein